MQMQPVVKAAVRQGLRTAGRTAAVQRVLHFYDFYGLIPPWDRPLTAEQATADVLRGAPTEMSQEERAFLFALVRGVKPRRVLEIGTAEGGSSLVMATAMEANGGAGRVYTIDPVPRIQFDTMLLHGRVDIVVGLSPHAIEDAAARADGPFDLVLIDGIHIYDQTKRDLAAALRHTAESAYVLLHDAFHYGVSEAIRETVESSPRLHDCGYVCNQPRPVGDLATHAASGCSESVPQSSTSARWWSGHGGRRESRRRTCGACETTTSGTARPLSRATTAGNMLSR